MKDLRNHQLRAVLIAALVLASTARAALAERHGGRRQANAASQSRPSGETKRLGIGDVKFYGFTSGTVATDLSTATLTGSNTMVEMPVKSSGALIKIHADEIKVTGGNRPATARLDLRGHLRYEVTQPVPEGARGLSGTAGRGEFKRETNLIELSDDVDCSFADTRLDGPGALHSGSVTVDVGSSPYVYVLAGNSGTNDIRFSPRQRDPKASPESQIGLVHVTHWDTGTFQTGKIARFDGALVIADLRSRSGSPEAQLKAHHIEGNFGPAGEIVRARANDGVHYRIERPMTRSLADGKVEEGRQQVTGTSNEALYEPDAGRFTLDGEIDATIINTLSLAEPARLLASRLVVTDVGRGKEHRALRFELTGAPNRRRLTFTPRAAEQAPDAAKAVGAPVFTLGSIVLTGFEKAVLEPGQSIDVVSDGKQLLLLDTSDARTHSASHMETHHFVAHLSESGAIADAETGGPVTFHIQQPGPVTAAKPAPGAASQSQSLDGNAAKAVYHTAAQGRSIALHGPFTARVTDPAHLLGPGSVKGEKDDTLSLDLVTREFDFQSTNQTIVLDFTPRPLPTSQDKPTPVPPAGKRKQ